jgi:hypothetical protein
MSDPIRTLDFLVIGAQKSGTTSLYQHLNAHPSVFVPIEKEAPFFNSPDVESGLESYLAEYFATARPDQVLGKVTPHYMYGPVADTAARIAMYCPQVRLVAILRDPVKRAFSEYRMARRRGFEVRSFSVALRELLEPERLNRARISPGETNGYVTNGEYGRILREYRERFNREQLLVLFTQELEAHPQRTLSEMYSHIGVDAGFCPPNPSRHYYQGGDHYYLPAAIRRGSFFLIRLALRGIPSAHSRRKTTRWLFNRYEQWTTIPRPRNVCAVLDNDTLTRMRQHFMRDASLLADLLGKEPPWAARETYGGLEAHKQ